MRFKITLSRTVYLVLIAVDQLCIRRIIQKPHTFIEGIR